MTRLLAVAFVAWISVAHYTPLVAQQIPPGVPTVAVRRIAQAIWPDQLFSAAGKPEPGFEVDGFRPHFTDLVIEARNETVVRLPGVRFYYGHAYPAGCSHCRTYVAAVAVRGDSSLTLMDANDINKLIPWLSTPIPLADSGAVRGFLIEALDATCIIGCRVTWLRPAEPLSKVDSEYVRHVDGSFANWTRPRTYSHVSPGQMSMEFLLIDQGRAIYRTHATQQRDGRHLSYFIEPSAWLTFSP